jgi:hypothetical protein
MTDNVPITPGAGAVIAADEVVDGVLGTVKVQYVKLMDGTLDGTAKAAVGPNGIKTDPSAAVDLGAGAATAKTQRMTIDTSQLSAPATATFAIASGVAPVALPTDQPPVATKVAAAAIADGASVTLGSKADAADAHTDVTAITAMSVFKQISKSIQLLVFGGGTQAAAMRTTLATDSPGIVTLGQTTKSASVPVAMASDQLGPAASAASLPVVLTPPVAALGSYSMGLASGTMAAGLAAAAPIASFRYGGTNKALVKKIVLSAGDTATAFAAGIVSFNLFVARSFTASDTGGAAATITGNNGKLATSFATTGISDFRASSTAALTPGTRTLDATPVGAYIGSVPAVAGSLLCPVGTFLFLAEATMLPLILAQNEGFVVQATVPGTGTWTFSVQVAWDEVSAF